jgi:hypothetical protein
MAQSPVGLIRGTVLTNESAPVVNAHVSADVMRGEMWIKTIDAMTDDAGEFVFPRLPMGEYRLSAHKAEAGYLSTMPDILDARPEQRVMLTQAVSSASMVIRLAPKAAVLTGRVIDATTGKLIPAHLSWAPYNDAAGGWGTGGIAGKHDFRLMFHADTQIRFGACAEGYKKWVYADPSNPSRAIPLNLRPDSQREFIIKLARSRDPQDQVCLASDY